MAFDSGTLKDENTSYKWDGKKRSIEAWNKDQTAETWMKESVVWYSQVVTRKMGRKRVQNYLNKFDYGSKDFSGDIETAWLTPAPFLKNPAPPTVLISGYEQIDFMKKLWQNKLPISERAAALTKKITFVETSPNGFKLYGKTGSGFLNKEETLRIGWFIAHLEKGDQSYVGVVTFNDLVEQPPGTFGGAFSREKMKEAFKEKGLF
jgi:beta-lactamase class D